MDQQLLPLVGAVEDMVIHLGLVMQEEHPEVEQALVVLEDQAEMELTVLQEEVENRVVLEGLVTASRLVQYLALVKTVPMVVIVRQYTV